VCGISQDSQRLRDLATLRSTRKAESGCINPLASTKQSLRIAKKKDRKEQNKMEQIDQSEILRRKKAGECLRCAWPADRKGTLGLRIAFDPLS
jgi:hypothetical protein